MKKFIINLAKFGVITLVIYVALTIVWGSYFPSKYAKNLKYPLGNSGYLLTRLKEAQKTKDIDILFIGSSHAYRGYDVRIFRQHGFTAFNLGSSAQTPTQTKLLLDDYIDRLNPKFVVFDINPKLFGGDGVESSLDLIANSKMNADLVKMVFQIKNITLINAFIYSGFRQALGLNDNFKQKETPGDKYIPGGYVESLKHSVDADGIAEQPFEDDVLSENQMTAFNDIISELKKREIDYVLVQAPIVEKRYKAVKNNREIDSTFSRYGHYYNFNKIIKLSDSAFYDQSHLNQYGVNQFNSKLLALLKKDIYTAVKE